MTPEEKEIEQVENQTGEKTGSSTSTTTSTTTINPYAPYQNVKDLDDAINILQGQVDAYKPETEEEREKREKREKRTGFLARLADGLGTLHTAYSHARGVKPMEMPQMSARATELYEKAKAERERERDRVTNLALQLGKLKGDRTRFGFEVEKTTQQQKNWNEEQDFNKQKYADARADRAEDVAHRDKLFDYQKQKDEADRAARDKYHNDEMSLKKQGLALQRQAQKFQQQLHDNSQMFTLGEGQGSVIVPRSAINSHNFSAIYNSLPKEYRKATGKPIYSTYALGKKVISGYSDPSPEQMAIAVGAFLGDESIDANRKTATRTALAQIGKKTGGNNMTMPGVE